MAQLHITLDQNEIMQLLLEDTGEAFKKLLEKSLNCFLKAESTEELRAQPYERTEERCDMRNGVRERNLTTRIGTLKLEVPRHRDVPFKTLIFENYERCEAALVTTMAEMVVSGVSTAKVGRVMETICNKNFSKQTVSEACKELDKPVEEFRNRSINTEYPFLIVDATYLKVRENHRIVSKAFFVAMALTPNGRKEILGFDLADSETKESWKHFFVSLKNRGLHGVQMVTSDAHEGLVGAMQEVFPDVPWQRCQAHLVRNILDATPKHLRVGLKSELTEMFNCETIVGARARKEEIFNDYKEYAPKAMECLEMGFDDAMTVMELPVPMRRCTRTSNYLERLNREIKRRANVIGIFPNTQSAMRLVGSHLIHEHEYWMTKRELYYNNAYEALIERRPQLIKIAQLQQQLIQAA